MQRLQAITLIAIHALVLATAARAGEPPLATPAPATAPEQAAASAGAVPAPAEAENPAAAPAVPAEPATAPAEPAANSSESTPIAIAPATMAMPAEFDALRLDEVISTPAANADAREPTKAVETFPLSVDAPDSAQEPLPATGQPAFVTAPARPVYADVWERIRSGFKLENIDDPLVTKWENFYAARPEYWQRTTERSKRYLYFIVAELERRGMPLEIALLPIIESAYNPEALSRARASGIWQFVPATGKTYGLQQNWWLDNRRDVTVATGSALDYLAKLYGMFGDWQLALASYNWGEGAVQRAMNRNRAKHKPVDYASLKVPTETRNYLPKLQAVKNLIMAPEKFGLELPAVPDRPYFTTVKTARQIDVALAARLADMPIDEFKILNPAQNRPVMAGEGEQRITLPYDRAETFMLNLDAYELPLVSWRPYQMKSGERLDQVAPRFGIDLDELKRINGLTGRKKIVPGHALLVPTRGGDAPVEWIPSALFKDAPNDGPGWHRVRRGETLAAIAQRYGVSAADLKRLNGLSVGAVAAGRRLRLHDGVSAGSGTPRNKPKGGKHGVRKAPTAHARRR